MRQFIFESNYSLGDVVLLTAAVRDLHRCYPGHLQTDVRTAFPDLWTGNPLLSPLDAYDPEVTAVHCTMPLVQRSNESACHCLHGFIDFLNQYLGTRVRLTECKGDIHLSRRERAGPSPLRNLAGADLPYWLISAGGRFDTTVKWWQARRYQEVVDHFAGRLQFVQVGHACDFHPRLDGVIDLRGQTTVRELVRLVHHAEGVVCGVTALMHLAAAVPVREGRSPSRPCVVVAGGRESPFWEAYPGHQFLHTVGALPCCAKGGCWRSRTAPLGDGDVNDYPPHLCLEVRDGLPRCMDLITSRDVIRAVETYLEGGAASRLKSRQVRAAGRAVRATAGNSSRLPLNLCTAPQAAERFIGSLPPYPAGFEGRGIVVCAGGVRMFTNAWVCLSLLRHLGCCLPIQLWHLGRRELDPAMRALLAPLGVECVDALRMRRQHPARLLHGWSLKPYAILHSPFKEVLLLDADNVPVRDPAFLFQARPYRRTGAVFWPDFGRLAPERAAWKAFGVPYRDEPEFETGQILVNKEACWEPLNLCLWYNEHSDFYYRLVHGDKETFHMAFRKLRRPYAMPAAPLQPLRGTMCQHDFQGQRLFQHRNTEKWTLITSNRPVRGFLLEEECRRRLRRLQAAWDGRKSTLLEPRLRLQRGAPFRPATNGDLTLAACMISCQPRDPVRQRTLARLARSDWAQEPLLVVLDQEKFASRKDNISHTAWRALRQCLQTGADYILCLEDDLGFSRHFRHNLERWPLLGRRELAFASFYNPGWHELAWDIARQATLAETQSFYGAQAVLISRPLAEYAIEHWFDGPPELDMKWKALLGQKKIPLLAHSPSLVQHLGRRSVWGGAYHRAADFDPFWKSPHPGHGSHLRILAAPAAPAHE